MNILITPTDDGFDVPGTPVHGRVWEGTTEKGTHVLVYVLTIAAPLDTDPDEFDGELVPLHVKFVEPMDPQRN